MKNTTNHTFDAIEALMLTDAYKLDHRRVYQLAESEGAKIQTVYSNFTNRGSRIPDVDKVVHFGLQAFIQYLDDKFAIFFAADEDEVCDLYEKRLAQILGPNDIGSDHIRALHRLGYLPLKFAAVPEGTRVPLRVPSFTVENTHPDFFWLTNYIETIMSAQVWQASTSATIAHRLRGVLEEGALTSGGSLEAVNWQGHDFSFRGMSSHETASMSGAGHLLSFFGTDSLSSLQWIDNYYGGEYVAGSVPATEHSVMCAGAATIGEKELFSRILDLYPSGIVSVVSDTFNLWTVLTEFAVDLKDKIMARDGKLVLRPDCYDEKTEILTDRGWVYFKDLKKSDLVAQVNDDGTRSFVKPLKCVDQYYEGPMVKFENGRKTIDLLVTPNHRMMYYQRKTNKEVIKTAEQLASAHHFFKRSAPTSNTDNVALSFEERLFIAFQADGIKKAYKYSKKEGKYIERLGWARFGLHKERKIKRLRWILDNLKAEGYSYKEYPLKNGYVEFQIKLPEMTKLPETFTWVDPFNCSLLWANEFLEEVSYWDATIRSEGRFKFDSTDEFAVDVVADVAITAGRGVTKSHRSDNRKPHFLDSYCVHIIKDNEVGVRATQSFIEDFKGRVYCVTVPSGRIIVRRNRSTLVCGNSGDPVNILTGTIDLTTEEGRAEYAAKKAAGTLTVEEKGALELLDDVFGSTINEKGFKELDSHIGLIYGDSITVDRAREINARVMAKGFVTTNIVYGVGSFTYQYNTRDTFMSAIKATWAKVGDEGFDLQKNPVTGDGMKTSAKGRLAVREENGELVVVQQAAPEDEAQSLIQPIWVDGEFVKFQSFADVRDTLASQK